MSDSFATICYSKSEKCHLLRYVLYGQSPVQFVNLYLSQQVIHNITKLSSYSLIFVKKQNLATMSA